MRWLTGKILGNLYKRSHEHSRGLTVESQWWKLPRRRESLLRRIRSFRFKCKLLHLRFNYTANTAAHTVGALMTWRMAFGGIFCLTRNTLVRVCFPGRSGLCIGYCLFWVHIRPPLECQCKYPVLSVLCAAVWDPEQPQDQHQRTFSSLSLQTYWTAAPHPPPSFTALSCEPALLLEIKMASQLLLAFDWCTKLEEVQFIGEFSLRVSLLVAI